MNGGKYETQLCVSIIEELFGKIVGKVVETLMKESSGFAMLVFKLKSLYPISIIRKSLSTLCHFHYVKFNLDTNMKPIYTVDENHILHVLFAPRACLIAKTLYGPLAEAICEEIFAEGRLTCSNTIRRVLSRYESSSIDEVKIAFAKLCGSQFLIRLPPIEGDIHGCPQFEKTYDPFVMPERIMEIDSSSTAFKSSRKRKDFNLMIDGDEGEYWKINWNRFDAYIRDELVLEFLAGKSTTDCEEKFHELKRNVIRMMLKLNEMRSSGIKPASMQNITASIYDIIKVAKENEIKLTKADVELTFQILCAESKGIVRKLGESTGGLFLIDVYRTISNICSKHCESLIREQFEGRAIRIMRLLELKHYLDEEQVEKLSMLSPKETREMLYALVEEGYVFTKPVGRANDFQPARTVYLYYVDLHRTVRGLVEYTSKFIRNLIARNTFERKENKPLLDKDATVGPIIEGIKANEDLDEESKLAQIAEVEEMYLPEPDRAQLVKFRNAQATLLASQDQASRVLISFKMFLSSPHN